MSPLNIMVCVKQVLDTRLSLAVNESGVAQKEPWPVYTLNPADRCALDEAIRLRDEAGSGTVTAVTIGSARAEAALAQCLARGADKAVHVLLEKETLDSFSVARVLSDIAKKHNYDLILCGNKTEDDGSSEVGSVMAEMLDIPQVTNVINLTINGNKLEAERKLERGYRQVLESSMPAVITVDTSICQPRYVTIRASSYKAKTISRDVERINLTDESLLNYASELRSVVGISPPKPRPKKIAMDTGASAADKMAMLMGLGGPPKKAAAQKSSGGPESAADEIIEFLKEKRLLG
ncbi:electron transfer flavoprotein subunit beta/FixA family protein [Phosphitispora sp. TUW77]|uniref:electron transfer flavoprotein subunit beta/FixA family protein n=1 Tax=Phosphitispora sp. TUW77 TaxID=3152361 RepID=UPI003AB30878